MSKPQKIERCIGCGRNAGILTPDNEFGLNQTLEAIKDFIEKPPPSDRGNACFHLVTNRTMMDDNAGVLYCLCADCCKTILTEVFRALVKERKEILFQDFDKIKEKLQDV